MGKALKNSETAAKPREVDVPIAGIPGVYGS